MRTDLVHIGFNLTFITPFHFGTGLRIGLLDRTVVRDHDGYLYVPGSTIKGVVREYCEQLARLYEEQDEMHEMIASPHDGKKALWALTRPVSMITRIFGAHHYPGHLFFDDARQPDAAREEYRAKEGNDESAGEDGDQYKALQTDIYTQVRLDRLTRTSVPGALYSSEFGVKDMTLEGTISGWLSCSPIPDLADGPTYSLLLLLAGLRMVQRLGSNKSAGKGRCTCDIASVIVNGQSAPWESWLDHLEALSHYSEQADQEATS